MFQNLLVPLDGSTCAEQALPLAAHLAHFSGGNITLLRIITPPLGVDVLSTQAALRGVINQEFTTAKDYLCQMLAAECLEGVGMNAEVRIGTPAQEILALAHAHPMDLIVMCLHGSALAQRIMGSVARTVARHSLIPVVILHEETPASLAQMGARPVRIMVGLDGTPFAEKVLAPAAYLCAALSAPARGELHLIRVLPRLSGLRVGQELYDGKETVDAVYALSMSDARTYLNDMERRLREPDLASLNLRVTSSVLQRDDVASTLRKAAESGKYLEDGLEDVDGCDLIALATHGRSGLSRFVLGSVAASLLETTMLPLLIVRPVEHAKQEEAQEQERVQIMPQEEYAIQVGTS